MPKGCPSCIALEEIECMVVEIKEITSINLSRSERFFTQGTLAEREKLVSEHRKAVEDVVNKIAKISREVRDAYCK